MMILRTVIGVYFTSIVSVSAFLNYDIIGGYFREKFINYASIIGCFSKKEQIQITKRFTETTFISVLILNNLHVEHSLKSQSHLGVILDGDCDRANDLLIQFGKHRYFNERHHWLILSSRSNVSYLFKSVEMYVNSDIQVVYPEESSNSVPNYIINTVYIPSSEHGSKSIYSYAIGFYNDVDGYNIRRKGENVYFIRRNMTGMHLKNAIIISMPFKGELSDYLKSDADRQINTYHRFHYNVLLSCQHCYNFTAEVKLTTTWGYPLGNGSYSGLVGLLARREIDYGNAPVYAAAWRRGLIDYGRKTYTHRTGFLFRNPQSLTSVEALVKPLSLWTWILTLLSAVILWFLLRLSCIYEEDIHHQKDLTWSYFAICIVGALSQQGMPTTPRLSSGRIVTLFLFIFALLMYQFYSASLVSSLLMERPTKIKTLDDLAHSNLKAGSEDYFHYRLYFMEANDEGSRKIYYEKILGPHNTSNFMSYEKGIDLINKGQFAFNVESNIAYPIIRKTFSDKAICELRLVELNRHAYLYTVYQKDSPFKEMFDTCLQRLAENGIMSREALFWSLPKPDCIASTVSGTFNIGLDEFYPALVVLGMGIVLSLLLLIYEKMSIYFRKETVALIITPFGAEECWIIRYFRIVGVFHTALLDIMIVANLYYVILDTQ